MRAVRRLAFSLLEVTLAVAIVGVTTAAVLGLLAGMARRSSDARDRRVAAGLADAIAGELRRQIAAEGWGAVVARSAHAGPEGGLRLVARRDGSGVRPWPPVESRPVEEYFLVEARRFPDGALAYKPDDGALPLSVTVSWPYRPGGAEDRERDVRADRRALLVFSIALNR
ncbi:MAG TPA: hypothetical protein VEB66_09770 [Opitutaceae bacterium]|nr:hypothetical protein [Opitutaceae bacterium]